MIAVLSSFSHITAKDVQSLLHQTDAANRTRLYKKNPKGMTESLLAHHTLYFLCEQQGIPSNEVEVQRLPSGKPVLLSREEHISLSHCANRVAAALWQKPIGIDVAPLFAPRIGFAAKICSKKELSHCPKGEDARIWTVQMFCIKEAYGKLTGAGLVGCRHTNFVQQEENIFAFGGFTAQTLLQDGKMHACCIEGTHLPAWCFITLEQLLPLTPERL